MSSAGKAAHDIHQRRKRWTILEKQDVAEAEWHISGDVQEGEVASPADQAAIVTLPDKDVRRRS